MGSDFTGVVDPVIAAALRQLRRQASGGLSRSLSVRGQEFNRRLPDAGLSGASRRNTVATESSARSRTGALWQRHFHHRESRSKGKSVRMTETAAGFAE